MISHKRKIQLFLFISLFAISSLKAQEKKAQIVLADSVYNFGYIAEEKGIVSTSFTFTNKGSEPLIITRVSTDCGCTTTSYPQEAVQANAKGIIRVAYNPQGRPGTFVKRIRIYSNSKNGLIRATIKGTVTTLGGADRAQYNYQIGALQVSKRNLSFPIATAERSYPIRLVMNNPSNKPLLVRLNVPHFLKVNRKVFTLKPGEPEEVMFFPNQDKGIKAGIYKKTIVVDVYSDKRKTASGNIDFVLPYLVPTPKREEGSPKLELDTYIDFGVGEDGEVYSTSLELKNRGQKVLRVYGVSSDNDAIVPSIAQKTIRSNRSGFILYTLDMNKVADQGGVLKATLSILVNDPMAPLRKVKIMIRLKGKN